MKSDDSDIESMETQFAMASGSAFAQARAAVLSAGLSVLETHDGYLYEAYPNGQRKPVKQIAPPLRVAIGTKYTIK